MYEAYWELSEPPFDNSPNPKFFYLSPEHEEALVRLVYTVSHRKGCGMLTGEYGCGKTTLARALIQRLEAERYEIGLLTNPSWNALDFLREVLYQLGVETEANTKPALLHALNDIFYQNYQAGRDSVVIVDEAQLIEDDGVFEELRLLLNFQTDDRFLVTLLLVGSPELAVKVRRMKHLDQRITLRYHLNTLDYSHTANYVAYRLKMAGQLKPLFTEAAIKLIFDFTRGTPREINNLSNVALLVGKSKSASEIDEMIIAAVIKDMVGVRHGPHERPRARHPHPARARAGAAADTPGRGPAPERHRAAPPAGAGACACPRRTGTPAVCDRGARRERRGALRRDPAVRGGRARSRERRERRVSLGGPRAAHSARGRLAREVGRALLGCQQSGRAAGDRLLGVPPGGGRRAVETHRRRYRVRPSAARPARDGRVPARRRPLAASAERPAAAGRAHARRAGAVPLAPQALGRDDQALGPAERWDHGCCASASRAGAGAGVPGAARGRGNPPGREDPRPRRHLHRAHRPAVLPAAPQTARGGPGDREVQARIVLVAAHQGAALRDLRVPARHARAPQHRRGRARRLREPQPPAPTVHRDRRGRQGPASHHAQGDRSLRGAVPLRHRARRGGRAVTVVERLRFSEGLR